MPKLSLVLLACGALLGNYLSLPLFYGVDLLFGGIFVFLTLLLHGKNCAIALIYQKQPDVILIELEIPYKMKRTLSKPGRITICLNRCA